MIRSYSELSQLQTFEERFEYLRLSGKVCDETFGFDRYLNQQLYRSAKWKKIRDQVIIRDGGCDLGIEDREVMGKVLIHHMNPITEYDLKTMDSKIFDPEYLITVSHITHNAIHYGDKSLLVSDPVVRTPGDTCLWR